MPKLTQERLKAMQEARRGHQRAVRDSDQAPHGPESSGSPLGAIRKKCLDCHAGSSRGVKYCPSDGVNSLRCALWPFRFGFRPGKGARKYGKQFLDPKAMPGPNTPLEDLS